MRANRQRSVSEVITVSAVIVGLLFLIKLVEILFALPLAKYGIVPRTPDGLQGVIWSPFLHANLAHLIANSLPLFVLLIVLLANPNYRPWRTLILIWIASGVGTWLIGRGESVHIGASSIIFGLVAFLIAAAFYLRSWASFAVAVAVFIFYGGGTLYGAIPQAGQVSWEGHLCGIVAGVWTAGTLKKSRQKSLVTTG